MPREKVINGALCREIGGLWVAYQPPELTALILRERAQPQLSSKTCGYELKYVASCGESQFVHDCGFKHKEAPVRFCSFCGGVTKEMKFPAVEEVSDGKNKEA